MPTSRTVVILISFLIFYTTIYISVVIRLALNAHLSTSFQMGSMCTTFSGCSKGGAWVAAWGVGALDVLAGSAGTDMAMDMGLEVTGMGTGAPGAARTMMTRAAATIGETNLL